MKGAVFFGIVLLFILVAPASVASAEPVSIDWRLSLDTPGPVAGKAFRLFVEGPQGAAYFLRLIDDDLQSRQRVPTVNQSFLTNGLVSHDFVVSSAGSYALLLFTASNETEFELTSSLAFYAKASGRTAEEIQAEAWANLVWNAQLKAAQTVAALMNYTIATVVAVLLFAIYQQRKLIIMASTKTDPQSTEDWTRHLRERK